jgi:hypothetical protein
VIGLGTESEYAEAQDFVARYGITFRMFWETSFKSWDGYVVWPTALLDPGPASASRLAGLTQMKLHIYANFAKR